MGGDGFGFEVAEVWQMGMALAAQVHSLTEALPGEERWVLLPQLRRAALSVPSNIAEGYGREHTRDKLKFLYNARGSLYEAKTQLLHGRNVGYFMDKDLEPVLALISKSSRQLNAFIRSLRSRL